MERTKYLRIEIKEPAQRTAGGKMLAEVNSWGRVKGTPNQEGPQGGRARHRKLAVEARPGVAAGRRARGAHRPLTLMPPRFLAVECRSVTADLEA